MNDALQQAMQALALQNGVARALAVFCAQYLIFIVAVGWLGVVLWRYRRLSVATLVPFVVVVALSFAAAKILSHVVVDTRPYLVEHTQPLAPTAADNGFPSDHTLLAATLTATLWWIDRRALVALAAATLFIMLGRLGIEAHHTLDVVGSVVIVAVAALVAAALPLPAAWRRPIFDSRHAVTLGTPPAALGPSKPPTSGSR